MRESDVQRLILGWLLTQGIFAWRNQSQGTYDAAVGRYRANNQVGALKGVPDILGILRDGRLLAIEVKAANGRVSPEQAAWIERANHLGAVAFVARYLDDVKKELLKR